LTILEIQSFVRSQMMSVTRGSFADQRPHRVALVTDWFAPRIGGIEVQLAGLARALQSRGVQVQVLTTTPGADIAGEIPVQRIPTLLLPRVDLAVSPGLIGKFRTVLVAGGFDLVHAHVSVVTPAAYAAVLAAHELGLPTVVTFHSVLRGSVYVLRAADQLCRWSRWPLIVSAVSGRVAQNLRDAVAGLAVEILPNGIDPSQWRRSAAVQRQSTDKIVTVTAMRLHGRKRPMALLRAFRIARELSSTGNRRLMLYVAGDGSERARLEHYVNRHGLGRDVVFLGALSRQALTSLYQDTDLFAIASIRESFGIAVLEARCAGLPVVALKASGAAELLRNGETALLADNDADFADCWARLALDDALRRNLSEPDAAVERFAWPTVAQSHIEVYSRAMELVRSSRVALNSRTA